MSVSIVWIDLSQAKLFCFSDERMERRVIRASSGPDHHAPSVTFYDEVAEGLRGARRLLILGAGLALTQFLHRLKEWHPQLFLKVVDFKTSEHPSDQQIAAYALDYLRKPAP